MNILNLKMRRLISIFFTITFTFSAISNAQASRLTIGIDSGYEPSAYENNVEWIPGHWEEGYWVPGQYVEYAYPEPTSEIVWRENHYNYYHHQRGHWRHHGYDNSVNYEYSHRHH